MARKPRVTTNPPPTGLQGDHRPWSVYWEYRPQDGPAVTGWAATSRDARRHMQHLAEQHKA